MMKATMLAMMNERTIEMSPNMGFSGMPTTSALRCEWVVMLTN